MTEEQIKTIAFFDGWEHAGTSKFGDELYTKPGQPLMTLKDMEYHTNWNWVIPVFHDLCQCLSKELISYDLISYNNVVEDVALVVHSWIDMYGGPYNIRNSYKRKLIHNQ